MAPTISSKFSMNFKIIFNPLGAIEFFHQKIGVTFCRKQQKWRLNRLKGNHRRILEQSTFLLSLLLLANKNLKIKLKLRATITQYVCCCCRRVSGSDNDNSPAKENQLSSVAGIFICSIYFCHMVISPVLFIFLF